MTSGGIGHQTGGSAKPSPDGRSVKTQAWIELTSQRKPAATSAIGTPRIAANTNNTTYCRVRSTAKGLTVAAWVMVVLRWSNGHVPG